jgi:phosphoglycolate phosphatase-like HAD superfamily hydrolase
MVRTWLFDFDNTAFLTFDPPPGGIGVTQAYELAIDEVLGSRALTEYRRQGGLRNRAPSEVVQELQPRRSLDTIAPLAERLVQAKLSHLVHQIGQPVGGGFWPLPCNGFVPFWHWLFAQNIRTGVISSGHTAFIEQVFQLHGLERPDVIVSDDDVRGRRNVRPQWLQKPGTFMVTLARRRLALEYGESRDSLARDKPGIIYFGDDAVKDGQLARAAGIRFGHFKPGCEEEAVEEEFCFPSWSCVPGLVAAPFPL